MLMRFGGVGGQGQGLVLIRFGGWGLGFGV